MKRIVFTVTNELNYDQRMIRICTSLVEAGYDITLIGHKKKISPAPEPKKYKQKRLFTFLKKGFGFYAEYNIRLFFCLLFAKATGEEQKKYIGNQTGGRVFLFLNTDDIWRDFKNMQARQITFIREPKEEAYGTVAVFSDLYGNLWDLIEPVKR